MAHRRSLFFLGAAWLLLALSACFRSERVAGGTETETTLSGRIVDSLGNPAAGAGVWLFARNHNPIAAGRPAPVRVTADGAGKYAFREVSAGTYNIRARDSLTGQTVLLQDVEAGIEGRGPANAGVADGVLRTPGRIIIPWDRLPVREGWVYIPGTDIAAAFAGREGGVDGLLLRDVPAGSYTTLEAADAARAAAGNLLQEPLVVRSGETRVLPAFAAWASSLRLMLNTTASGAGIPADVTQYPLLVRLDASNFDFAQAGPDGADIRFSKPDGTPLEYQIERWDAAARRAEIWVRIDTVYGNRSDQWLRMHYGNPGAADRSDGPAVFSPVHGFSGVWHLSDTAAAPAPPALWQDATGFGRHGSGSGAASLGEGRIGGAGSFDGTGGYIDLPRSSAFIAVAGQPLTISCWFKPDSAGAGDSRLLDIHRSDTNGSTIALGYGKGGKLFAYNHSSKAYYQSQGPVPVGTWHLAAMTYDGKAFRLYLDGEEATAPVQAGLLAGGEFRAKIGKFGDRPLNAFTGAIDEARFATTPRSAAWIKLDFASQSSPQNLLTIRP